MRRFRTIALATVLIAAAAPARSETPLPAALEVLGSVTNSARPVANALVIALNLQDFAAEKTFTGLDGKFNLPTLRGGIYKIIAVKNGFVPAIHTLVPTAGTHTVALRLENENKKKKTSATQEIWELRGSLPPDVLRDLDSVLQATAILSYEVPRFRGEMLSMTGAAHNAADPAFAQTALGVHGRIGDKWQVGIRGNMQRFDNGADGEPFGTPLAESSVMSMELRSSPTASYKVASTKSSWRYNDPELFGGADTADVRTSNFEWRSGESKVEVRYFAQENLFSTASNLIEVAGQSTILQTRRTDLGVHVRVMQESVASAPESMRLADVTANGSMAIVPSFVLHYGVSSRLGVDGQDWAPRTGAEWKLTENTSFIGSALYKIADRDAARLSLPSVVYWSETDRVLPKYAYTFGIVHDVDGNNRISAIATVSEVDEPLRVVFGDGYDQFWDGLYIQPGDVRRDVRVAYRKQFGNVIAIDIATSAGSAEQRDPALNDGTKTYVTGDLQSHFSPTRTTLLISYREIQQPGDEPELEHRTERINLRMAQSLYLPVDLKLLLGLELARSANSPYLVDTLTPEGRSKKYLGGLALNF
ncbi:MAG TPA: carboxypeptidase-like regulatory domain-containing protein [Thermoanaerobaculia bacterium]|nr:carboxypeptidase-like regulatory domain-containing protein [Thermoanaerobaculia bacterium]